MKRYVIKSLLLLMMIFMIVSCRNPIENNLTVNKFTVTFDSMGGSLVTSAEAFENSLATTPTAPTKADYKLGGWYTDNTTFTNKWDFATNKVTGNITLYAKWITNSCTVTYNSNGGTAVSPATEKIGKIIIAPIAPTKSNNSFGGWYTDNTTSTNKWNFVTNTVAGDMTLYAKWIANEIFVEAGTAGTSGITTTKSFYIQKYEVTQSQYLELMGYNPSGFPVNNHPVENVTLYDAITYANNLSIKEGFDKFYNISGITKTGNNITSATVTENSDTNGYRLPTADEWMYAAKGGKLSQNYTYAGSNIADAVAWTSANNTTNGEISGTKEIGRKTPNELGIYDMSGNVNEWISRDNWSLSLAIQYFIGGSWKQVPSSVLNDSPVFTSTIAHDNGFRLVRDY